jgi:hypothetical protein
MTACEQARERENLTDDFIAFLAIKEGQQTLPRFESGEAGVWYCLQNGVLFVADENGEALWRSNDEWWVDDFRLGDVDGDGNEDFLMSLWKSYRFGNAHPAWLENDDETVRNHLFLYSVSEGAVYPIWCSSSLPRPLYRFELDPSGRVTPVSSGMLLRTDEGEYQEDFSQTAATAYVYAWQGWGFVEVDIAPPTKH